MKKLAGQDHSTTYRLISEKNNL